MNLSILKRGAFDSKEGELEYIERNQLEYMAFPQHCWMLQSSIILVHIYKNKICPRSAFWLLIGLVLLILEKFLFKLTKYILEKQYTLFQKMINWLWNL